MSRRSSILLVTMLVVGVVSANPVLEFIINEISTEPGNQWVELHTGPDWFDPVDLRDWRIVTKQTECTLNFVLQRDVYVVVDSALLAQGWLAKGALRFDPEEDSITLISDSTWEQSFFYPYVGRRGVPTPPPGGSASIWSTWVSFRGGGWNWYVDSTATPGRANDDYSVITGRLLDSLGRPVEIPGMREVVAYGTGGWWRTPFFSGTEYRLEGLSVGKYCLVAYTNVYEVTYPDSVEVGYSETVSGIDFRFPVGGIAEVAVGGGAVRTDVPARTVIGGVLPLPGNLDAALLDIAGRKVMSLQPGENDIRHLAPGIYFIRRGGDDTTTKVVIQR